MNLVKYGDFNKMTKKVQNYNYSINKNITAITILPEISVFSSLVASQHFETYKRRVNIMILFRNRELFVSKLQKKREKKNTDRQKK